jgi:hypothetical protein
MCFDLDLDFDMDFFCCEITTKKWWLHQNKLVSTTKVGLQNHRSSSGYHFSSYSSFYPHLSFWLHFFLSVWLWQLLQIVDILIISLIPNYFLAIFLTVFQILPFLYQLKFQMTQILIGKYTVFLPEIPVSSQPKLR